MVAPGSPIKKPPTRLVYHPFSNGNPTDKPNAMKIGGDKARQKEDAITKDKEISDGLHQSLKHIFDSPITEGMRVIQGDSRQSGTISFSGHPGDWFQPRTPEDFTISLGREITDPSPLTISPYLSSHIIV